MPLLSLSQCQAKSVMEASGEKPKRKPSKRETKARSATLPAGAVLVAHPGEGFFTKIRRCLRLGNKGKYDLNHSHPVPDADSGNPSARPNRSSLGSSPVNEGGDAGRLSSKSSPRKTSRRVKSEDKEEVLLIRKDKRASSGITVANKSAVEGDKDGVLVVTIGQEKLSKSEQEAVSGASGICTGDENKENDEVFEDFDPDYETLDDIRRKVRSQVNHADIPASPSTADQHKATARQPLQVKIKTNSDLNRRDSGLGSPFTDSPGSSRESQAHSVTSSVLSNSAVFSDSSEPFREQMPSTSSVVFVSGVTAPIPSNDPMVTSSTSLLNGSNSALEADDLYSNAKVLIRKKSQKQSQSQTSLSAPEQRSSGLFLDQPRSARNSLSPADLLALMEAENPTSAAPPPLPARNYSEEDVATQAEKSVSAEVNSAADLKSDVLSACGELDISVSSETLCNGAGARPKTPKHDAVIEQGPVLTMNVNQNNLQTDNLEFSDAKVPDTLTPLTPTNNIYEDIPLRIGNAEQCEAEALVPSEEKRPEDDLLFIDEDPSADGDCQSERTENSELPEDVMIVSASDSMCGTETDESQGNTLSPSPKRINLQVQLPAIADPVQAESPAVEVDETAIGACGFQEELRDLKDSDADKTKPEPCSKSDSKEDASNHQDIATPTSSSSSSHQLSVSSPSTDSPSIASSSDTLNDIADHDPDPEPDPDDFEGKDLSPPTGPPIHVSHRQLLQRLDTKPSEDEPPPVPERRRPGRRMANQAPTARNVRSMEIPPTVRPRDRGGSRSGGSSNARRHSSSAASASRAHRDFLASMKQLKDCGWYWGPLSYEEAESKLIDKRDGSFLVRDSSNENYILSLSFKSMGQVHHTRIEHHKGLFSFWSQPDSHGKAQISQFIEQTVENSKNGRFLYFLRPAGPGSPPLPIQLLYPVSRFCRVPSLQHMCRFLVLRWVRRDHVDHLPLPQKVKAYLLEKQYYVETLEED